MSKFSRPAPAQTVVNAIYSPELALDQLMEELIKVFGDINAMSREFSFTETEYYQSEMGPGLLRRLVSLGPAVEREELPRLKMIAWDLEKRFARDGGGRRVNLDPGYISLENFVLTSFKNFSHRIYLGQGVYGEVTLIFKQGSFQTLAWTYPFYRRDEVIGFLNRVRERFHWQLRDNLCREV